MRNTARSASREKKRAFFPFNGFRVDAAVSKEVLEAFSGNAIQAPLEAAEHIEQKRENLRKAAELGVVRRGAL